MAKKLFFIHKGTKVPLDKNYKMSTMLKFCKEVDKFPKLVIKNKKKELVF